jgi:hypothetical protein
MDGVLADFDHGYRELSGQDPKDTFIPNPKDDPVLSRMIGTDFFARLPKYKTADRLVQMVVDRFGSYSICSSPLRGDHDNSEHNKKQWIQQHLNPQPASIVITGRKEKYAIRNGVPNILIDDKSSNIAKWTAKGGIGILYYAPRDSLNQVAKVLDQSLNEEKIEFDPADPEHEEQFLRPKEFRKQGAYSYVTHHPSHDPHMVQKTDRTALPPEQNPFYQYARAIATAEKRNTNPYLPRVRVVDAEETDWGGVVFTYECERLHDFTEVEHQLGEDVVVNIGRKMFNDYDTLSRNYIRDHRGDNLNAWEVLAGILHFMQVGHKWNWVKDPLFKQALDILKEIDEQTGNFFQWDWKADNLMIRFTSKGPQLVLTDPLS